MERVNLVRTLVAQGRVATDILAVANQLMARRGVPEIGLDTIYEDRRRLRELQDEERAAAAGVEQDQLEQHLTALHMVEAEAWKAFHTTGSASLNRSGYLNVIRGTRETIAKLDGSMIHRAENKVEVRDHRNVGDMLEKLLERELGNAEAVDRVLTGLITDDSGVANVALTN
jgi:hypothetical protein